MNLQDWFRAAARQVRNSFVSMRGDRTEAYKPSWSATFTFWSLLICSIFATYTLLYLGTPALPGNPEALQGWWGWYDQSKYIASAQSFADGTWRSIEQIYPPLYPWLGAWFIGFWPAHPFFLIDFVGFMLNIAALIVIGGRLFGTIPAWLAVIATFLLFPFLTIQQWEIPWTTSLSSGIGACLLLIFFWFSDRQWRVKAPLDWVFIGLVSLGYGSISAVRPLEVLVWFPAALTFYISIAYRNLNICQPDNNISKALRLSVSILVAGLLVPAFYIYFNYVTSQTIFGSYIINNSNNGYQVHSLLRKSISLLLDSKTVYVEAGQAISDQFWLLYLAIPTMIYFIFIGNLVTRIIILTIFLQYFIYIPYSDLIPNGMYRYNNIHYFSWTFPWLTMICINIFISFFYRRGHTLRRNTLDLGVVALTLLTLCISLRARPVGNITVEAESEHGIVATLNAPYAIDVIDFTGVSGPWSNIYFGTNTLQIDGHNFPMISDFRLLPAGNGLRLILPRTILGQRFSLGLDPGIVIDSAILSGRAARIRASLQCRFKDCTLPPLIGPLPVVTVPASITFDANGHSGRYLADGWSDPEDWGRWSSAPKAHLAFRLDHPTQMMVEVELQPLLSAARPLQTVTVTANSCPIGSVTFSLPDRADGRTITGEVPASCVHPNGIVELEFSTDRAVTPRSIGIGEDTRILGMGLVRLEIR